MELTSKECEIIKNIRTIKEKATDEKIIITIIYEPLTDGWLQVIRVADSTPITAIRSEMKQMLGKMKKELGTQQALFNVFYDGGVLGFNRAISVADFLKNVD